MTSFIDQSDEEEDQTADFPLGDEPAPSKVDKKLDYEQFKASLMRASSCSCASRCVSRMKSDCSPAFAARAAFFSQNRGERASLLRLVQWLALKEFRTLELGREKCELCDSGIRIVLGFSERKYKHARAELEAWRESHPDGPPSPSSVDDLVPHGNAARARENTVYLELLAATREWCDEHAQKQPDGSFRLPSRIGWFDLFRLVGPDWPISRFSSFKLVCFDIPIFRYDKGPSCFSCSLPLLHVIDISTLRSSSMCFLPGTQRNCAICYNIATTPRSKLTRELRAQKQAHSDEISSHDVLRMQAKLRASQKPEEEIFVALDFASSRDTWFPNLYQNVRSFFLHACFFDSDFAASRLQVSLLKFNVHVGGLDVSTPLLGSLVPSDGYFIYSLGEKNSNTTCSLLYLATICHKQRFPSARTAHWFVDGAAENLNQYVLDLAGDLVGAAVYAVIFIYFSVPEHSAYWIDRCSWFRQLAPYFKQHSIRDLTDVLDSSSGRSAIYLGSVGDFKSYFEERNGKQFNGIKGQRYFRVQMFPRDAVPGSPLCPGFLYRSDMHISLGWSGDKGKRTPCFIWDGPADRSHSLPVICFAPPPAELSKIPRLFERARNDYPDRSRQRIWFEEMQRAGSFGVTAVSDVLCLAMGEDALLSGSHIRAVLRFPQLPFLFPQSWTVRQFPDLEPDWRALQLNPEKQRVVEVVKRAKRGSARGRGKARGIRGRGRGRARSRSAHSGEEEDES
jgi:hypothetical protein